MTEKRESARKLLREGLGKAADEILKKVDRLAKEGIPAPKIEEAIDADLCKLILEAKTNVHGIVASPGPKA